jgi:hypothetical protein
MSLKKALQVCRVCLVSSSTASLSCLFENAGENAKNFKLISGIEVSSGFCFVTVIQTSFSTDFARMEIFRGSDL